MIKNSTPEIQANSKPVPTGKKTAGDIRRQRPRTLAMPNVAGFFLAGGEGPPPPIRMRTRPLDSASGRHDLLYLSSCVHDASFSLEDIGEFGKWLVIPLNRERWELARKDLGEATYVRSEIRIGSVKWWTVELRGRNFHGQEKPLESMDMSIHGLQCSTGEFLVEESNDEQIVIDCTSDRIKVRVGRRLRDRACGPSTEEKAKA